VGNSEPVLVKRVSVAHIGAGLVMGALATAAGLIEFVISTPTSAPGKKLSI
jgi:uncharacterized membrane protein